MTIFSVADLCDENQEIQKLEEILNRDLGINHDFASISNSRKNKEEIYSKLLEFIKFLFLLF